MSLHVRQRNAAATAGFVDYADWLLNKSFGLPNALNQASRDIGSATWSGLHNQLHGMAWCPPRLRKRNKTAGEPCGTGAENDIQVSEILAAHPFPLVANERPEHA
jgi:hypothetical protein